MSWQARQESKRVKREKTVVWRWLLGKSLTRNLRIQTEFVPDIVSKKVIIIQQRAIVGDQVVLIKTCHYWIYLTLQVRSDNIAGFVWRLLEALTIDLQIKVRWVLKNLGNSLFDWHWFFWIWAIMSWDNGV